MTETLAVPSSLVALSPLDRQAAERARGRALALMDRALADRASCIPDRDRARARRPGWLT